MHGPDGIIILPDDPVIRPPALADVAVETADKTDVGVDVKIDLHVEKIADLRLPERIDPLDEHRAARPHAGRLLAAPIERVIVVRDRDGTAILEDREMLPEKLPVERLGMVEVGVAVP